MNFIKVISSVLDKEKRRLIKYLRYGKDDVQTSFESSSFGIDSNPIEDLIAIYGKTSGDGDTVVVGYIQKNRIADVGELRMFSTDSAGAEKNYMWLLNDGTIEIGGNDDNMVRFSELKKAFDQLKSEHDSLVTSYNAHTHLYAPGPSAPVPSAPIIVPEVPSIANIDPSKITNIKTKK